MPRGTPPRPPAAADEPRPGERRCCRPRLERGHARETARAVCRPPRGGVRALRRGLARRPGRACARRRLCPRAHGISGARIRRPGRSRRRTQCFAAWPAMPRNPSACDVRRALRTGRSCARVPWGHCAAGLRGRPAHRSLWPRSPRAPFAPIRRAPPPSRLRLHRPFVRVCVRGLPPSPFRRRAALRAAPPFGEAPRGRGSSRSWRRRAP